MARIIAFNAIFFLLPFAGYAVWLLAAHGSTSNAAYWAPKRIGYLAIGGAALMIVALLAFTSFSGAPPGSTYVPAKVGSNGELIPGHFQ